MIKRAAENPSLISRRLLRAGIQLQTVNAVVRNLRLQRIYIESDR
jgi:hypothetical protein